MSGPAPRRVAPEAPARRGWCPGLARPMPTGDGLLARIHPPLGRLTPAQVRAVAEAARRFGNGQVDVTARANLQIRGVTEATRAALATALEAAGLGDSRADGGPQRLSLTSPLADLDPAERFDVAGLAAAIEAEGRAVPGLPAKTLVAMAGERHGVPVEGADLFVRALDANRAAIGLATGDGFAWTGPWPASAIATRVGALLSAFARTGRRRLRDLDGEALADVASAANAPSSRVTIAPYASPLPAGRGEGRDDLVVGVSSGSDGEGVSTDMAHPEKPPHPRLPPRRAPRQEGDTTLSPHAGRGDALPAGLIDLANGIALAVEAPFGRCDADGLTLLADTAEASGADAIRLSASRGFVLPAANEAAARAALARLAVAGFVAEPGDPRRAVAACPGAPACASGSTPVPADAARLAQAFRPFAARGLRAHVSGCAKGCAHPATADLTLVGTDGLYAVVLGGTAAGEPAMQLTFEAALERVRRADSAQSLERAFRDP